MAAGGTADYGKMETRIIGQSTMRPWTKRNLPNIRVDADAFKKKLLIGGFEHLRFNNGLVGSIFRERIALELFKRLDYPVPRSSFAWVGSNIWGPDIWVPYTVVEVYKKWNSWLSELLMGEHVVSMLQPSVRAINRWEAPLDRPKEK